MMYENIFNMVGNTPLIKIYDESIHNINLYVKMEGFNPTGSIKDRAAKYIIDKVLKEGVIDQDTTIMESSSGNFGIALSAYCHLMGLKFYCVIDPLISEVNKMLIEQYSTKVIQVTERDRNGAYLLNRIEMIHELKHQIPNSYWVDQYGSVFNAEAYYHTLGNEICEEVKAIDYIFIGVSSGGTITGLSKKIKEKYPKVKVIAVDIVGSVIFGGTPKKRYIPGIGSSKTPEILKYASIDEVIQIEEVDVVKECNNLLYQHTIFAGGSSGAVFSAIKQYFSKINFEKKPNVVTIFVDRGDRYANTIYSTNWCKEYIH